MTKQCGACGARQLAPFENETFEIEHHGRKVSIAGLSGDRCGACGEVIFDAESAHRYAAASDELVLAARESERVTIKRIRVRLGLTQEQAAFLTGGGPNAFSRYETGKARPMPAVVNLFRLLDAHPDLLKELPEPPVKVGRLGRFNFTVTRARRSAKPLSKAAVGRRRGAARA